MSERTSHKFQFPASQIAEAAKSEAEYHLMREAHWKNRERLALNIVEGSIGAKVVRHQTTGGSVYGRDVTCDNAAWSELLLAEQKAGAHRLAADRFRTEAAVYGTQGDRVYELDPDDVHHFRLGGQPRED